MSGAATIFSLASGDCKLLADIAESGGMGIWARPDADAFNFEGEASDAKGMFGSADSLRGKTFFAALGTSSQFNVLRYIQQYGLEETDIDLVHMDSGPAAQAFLMGEGDFIASMPPYSTQLEADGCVKVCTFEEATGTALYDMMFAPNVSIETRRDDLVSFVRAIYKAMDEMSDDAARLEFTLPWFQSEGKEYTEESLAQEIGDRQYCDSEAVKGADYVFGAAMIGYAEYNVAIEKLEPEQVDNVRTCFDATILEDALGIDVAIPA
jgi:ABC-type nitrate/sulfonate/bicarbonate transport system substrate-binding protein